MDTIIQWNCRGLRHNFNELKLLISTHNPIAICLQETYVKDTDNITLKNYTLYNSFATVESGKSSGGVSILIRNDVAHQEIKLNSNLQVKAVTLTAGKRFTICSIYLPPQRRVEGADLDSIIQQIPGTYLLLGDFNAHHTLWGASNINNKGKTIEDFLNRHQLVYLNDKTPTYIHPGHKTLSTLDLALCHPGLALDFNFNVLSDLYGSDHYPVLLTSTISESNEKIPLWNFKRANWDKYESLSEQLSPELMEGLDMDHFTSTLQIIAEECIPKSSAIKKKPRYPWFNNDCKNAIKLRRKSLKIFKKYPTNENCVKYKIAYAKARRIIRRAKRDSWREYVSRLNARTPIKKTWDMIRKISGKFSSSPVNYLETERGKASSTKEIADALGASFAQISSSENCTDSFRRFKEQAERRIFNFDSSNEEDYNLPFTIKELDESLSGAKDTAAGPDNIHYQLLKHLSKTAKETLLFLFNDIFSGKQNFPPEWRKATVIPFPKPGKDPLKPNNYRPIALTSCLCKVMERMINNRLVWFLETNKVLSPFQAGFRKNRSTNDQLVRFETLLRDAFVKNDHVVSIFFDLEKAYDTTFKHGILKDMHEAGLRGNLPHFVKNFLTDREFNVRVGTTTSENFIQEMGVPQGSILSPTLFNLKINSIVKCLSDNVDTSLYVDDFLISYRSKNLNAIERKLQLCLRKLETWCNENGFKFSPTKTVCVHFTQTRKACPDPELYLNGNKIPIVNQVKFLGVIFDKKLSFLPHIKYLKDKCIKALNLLKIVSKTEWGGDRKVLLRLYRSLIRSQLDYGSIVYGSARKSYLQILDPIAHQGIRLALGAFRTSPVESLLVEANEPSLKLRREKLSLQYAMKLAAHTDNPTYNCVFEPQNTRQYETKENAIRSFGLRVKPILEELHFELDQTITETVPEIPPWTQTTPIVNFEMSTLKKSETAEDIFKSRFNEIKEKYPDYQFIYTDGSKTSNAVAAAAVTPISCLSKSCNKNCSIFSAELRALEMALQHIDSTQHQNYMVCSDSKSSLQALQDLWTNNPLVRRIIELNSQIHNKRKNVIFLWLPSHVGIRGNEAADQAAKDALTSAVSVAGLPASDWKPKAQQHIQNTRAAHWEEIQNNKLKEIVPDLREHYQIQCYNRKDEVVFTRLRIGHSYLTHSFLLKGEPPPECIGCNARYTVKHILLECVDFLDVRNRYYNCDDMCHLFKTVKKNNSCVHPRNRYLP